MSGATPRFDACHQIIGVLADRDAVGDHTVATQRALRSVGLRSEIYAARVIGSPSGDVRPLDELPSDDGRTVVMYQASGASPAWTVARARTEPLMLNYHNVTPSTFFHQWEPGVAEELVAARAQITQLAWRAVAGIADSPYNARELVTMGCPRVEVVPVLIDLQAFTPALERRAGATSWLFVGRLCPNKAQHDVVRAFAAYRSLFDADATLSLVGGSSSPRYEAALRSFIEALHVTEHVQLTGLVDQSELIEHYRRADVFVCLSEHEGFCNTVVEAMACGTPVVAYGAAALPETVATGGALIDDKDPLRVATLVERIVRDASLRSDLVAAGHRRVAALGLDAAGTEMARSFLQLVA